MAIFNLYGGQQLGFFMSPHRHLWWPHDSLIVAFQYFVVGFSFSSAFPPRLLTTSCLVLGAKSKCVYFSIGLGYTIFLQTTPLLSYVLCPIVLYFIYLYTHILCGSLHLHASTMVLNFRPTCHDSFFKDEHFFLVDFPWRRRSKKVDVPRFPVTNWRIVVTMFSL